MLKDRLSWKTVFLTGLTAGAMVMSLAGGSFWRFCHRANRDGLPERPGRSRIEPMP